MKLRVLGSSSHGNCYLIESEEEILIVELGIPFKDILQAIDFRLDKVVGCLVSHCHKDHSKSMEEAIRRGLIVYSCDTYSKHKSVRMGGFYIQGFECQHDVPCIGFYINHEIVGNLLFATDTYYVEYKFPNVNHMLVECNYSKELLEANVDRGHIHPVLADRLRSSHFELGNVKAFLHANNLQQIKNIVLLHLSAGNSNSNQFEYEIYKLTGKPTVVACKGLELDLKLVPF